MAGIEKALLRAGADLLFPQQKVTAGNVHAQFPTQERLDVILDRAIITKVDEQEHIPRFRLHLLSDVVAEAPGKGARAIADFFDVLRPEYLFGKGCEPFLCRELAGKTPDFRIGK